MGWVDRKGKDGWDLSLICTVALKMLRVKSVMLEADIHVQHSGDRAHTRVCWLISGRSLRLFGHCVHGIQSVWT